MLKGSTVMTGDATRRDLLRAVGAGAVGTAIASGAGAATLEDGTATVAPPFADGFVLTTLTPAAAPTAVRFGPDDGRFGGAGAGDNRPDLYAATLNGDVVRYP